MHACYYYLLVPFVERNHRAKRRPSAMAHGVAYLLHGGYSYGRWGVIGGLGIYRLSGLCVQPPYQNVRMNLLL